MVAGSNPCLYDRVPQDAVCQEDFAEKMNIKNRLRIRNQLVREMLAELMGTFILVTFVVASGAQFVLSRESLGNYLTVNIASGMGLTFGLYWSAGVSGGCLNPAVSLAFCLEGIVAWWKYPFYVLAELTGAFLAAAVQFGVYYDALNAYDGGVRVTSGPNATAGIFTTMPNIQVSTINCYFDQVFGSFILIGCILAATDDRNMKPHKGLIPIAMGALLVAIGACWTLNCGYAINPARDLGPRIFCALAGWGVGPFSHRNYNWFWVPIVGPMTGSLLSWAVYNLAVKLHWPEEDESDLNEEEISASVKRIAEQSGEVRRSC